MLQDVEQLGGPARFTYCEDANIPDYLNRHYWWAYVHPKAVHFFDRGWVINLILLGNYHRLRDAALAEFSERPLGRMLQISCAYGDLSARLARRAAKLGGTLEVVDVLPIQLKNLKWKLPSRTPARLLRMDSTDLRLPDQSYEQVLLFFLLHEQPADIRSKTLREALRVLKPGGKLVIVEFAKPKWWNPMRYLLRPLLGTLEPFALDLWDRDLVEMLPPFTGVRRSLYYGGLYQKLVVTR
ncbi:MAG: rhodoquinone biosynthesis methyltransferase RquA [Alphaproteobacteria bacterium]|nr:rhodoquinone biosynthesis methyltransferase RquA [Alphaproteobacteria bacterium]